MLTSKKLLTAKKEEALSKLNKALSILNDL